MTSSINKSSCILASNTSFIFFRAQIKPAGVALTGHTIRESNTPLPSSWGTLAATVLSCQLIRSSPLPQRHGWPWSISWSMSVTILIEDCITTDRGETWKLADSALNLKLPRLYHCETNKNPTYPFYLSFSRPCSPSFEWNSFTQE